MNIQALKELLTTVVDICGADAEIYAKTLANTGNLVVVVGNEQVGYIDMVDRQFIEFVRGT